MDVSCVQIESVVRLFAFCDTNLACFNTPNRTNFIATVCFTQSNKGEGYIFNDEVLCG